jgi:hypothetical protein
MHKFTRVVAIAVAIVILAGCHNNTKAPASATPAATPTATPAPAAAPVPPPAAPVAPPSYTPADLKAAFAAAFGGPAPAVKIVTRDDQETTLRYRPAKLVPVGAVTALISEARSDGCHGCYGELAIHYLTRDGAGFKRVGAWPEISDGGSFGEPPNWSIRTDLFSGPALVADAGGTWQGCTVAYADVIELTPDRPIVRAKRVLITYSDANADGNDVDGTLRPIEKDHAFAVDYAGAHKRTVGYVKAGEVYQAARGGPGLPSC